jgi:large subunit ribosomal protein L23
MVEAEKIIIRPIISEKSYRQIDDHRYTFEVHPTAHVPSKPKRRGASRGRSRSWKKAVVTLTPTDKIEFFEGR